MTLGIFNGVFFNLAAAFLSGITVIPLFISGFTDSRILIGAFSTLESFGWYFPQLFMGALIAGRPLVLTYYNKLSFSRVIFFAAAISLIFLVKDSNHRLLLIGFGCLFGIYSITSGMAGIAFMEIVGKMIPTNKRGTLFGLRMFFGGLLAVLAGPIVKYMLDRWQFPVNFGYLFFIALITVIMGLAIYAFTRELPPPVMKTKPGFKDNLAKSLSVFKNDVNMRHLVFAMYSTNTALLAMPFYIILATEQLGIPGPLAATYLSFERIGFLGLNLLWGWLSNRISNKLVLKVSTIFAIMAPALALYSIYHYPGYFIFGLVFFFNGAALSGTSLGYINYLLEISNDENRVLSIGLVHTFIAPTIFFSALGGLLFELFSIKILFLVTLIGLSLSYIYINQLKEPVRVGREN